MIGIKLIWMSDGNHDGNRYLPTVDSNNMDSLTGVGSDFNLEGTPDRLNSQERAEERFKGIDVIKTS